MAKWITVRVNLTRLNELLGDEKTIEFLSQVGDDTIEFGGVAGMVAETADKDFFKRILGTFVDWLKKMANPSEGQ